MITKILANPLGDIRAEADHNMLIRSFYETPDYFSLLTTDEKVVVVGRRGTGKSALNYKLNKQWSSDKNNIIIEIAPEEHHTLGLIPMVTKTGSNFLQVRAVSRLLWKYGLLLEICAALSSRYKVKEIISNSPILQSHLTKWNNPGLEFFEKLRKIIKEKIAKDTLKDEIIGDLAEALEINKIEKEMKNIQSYGYKSYILIDKLDEGFDPTTLSVAFIDGAINACIDLFSIFKGFIRPVVFLRDNIYRAVAHYDQDYARNIEGQTLRIHWDVNNLFYLVCNRLRASFSIDQENNKRLWNKFVCHNLQGEEGFKKCLSYTLYRPRDILILLNSALENSSKRDLSVQFITITEDDIEKSARNISVNRLDDLKKEYKQIFPTIEQAVDAFEGMSPELNFNLVSEKLEDIISNPPDDHQIQIELAILESPEELIRSLYSVGFIGRHDGSSDTFVFSHDGKRLDGEFIKNQRLLIHPCYWMALNIKSESITENDAHEINDEYEIKVTSQTPEIRISKLNRLMSEYTKIPLGHDGASDFENWCLEAVKICFAARLENVALPPNKDNVNRRDIVGTNLGIPPCWQRIREDYQVRQTIFECKNYNELKQDDYRQILSYLSGNYGKLAFVICRSENHSLERERELDWFKSIYNDHKVMIIKLTAKFLASLLGKLRSPKKHYTPDQQLGVLLDTYERNYLGQNITRKTKANRKK